MPLTSALAQIEALFARHTRQHHFYLRDLRDGREWESGVAGAYPIGSCFKLALLMAVFDALDVDEMDRPVEIPPERFVDAVGVIRLIDSAISLTPHQMCQLILTASDATATDVLIERVGLNAVDAVLRRHAPRSHIARNLEDMVRDFRAMPEAVTCKQRDWAVPELEDFTGRVAAMGSTDARDLAALVQATWNYQPKAGLRDHYRRCLDNRKRLLLRTAMFDADAWLTKTGSLGATFFINDSGLLFDTSSKHPIAAFGWCAVGSSLPAFMMETLGGYVGLSILDLLDLDHSPNGDWTPAGMKLLLGDAG